MLLNEDQLKVSSHDVKGGEHRLPAIRSHVMACWKMTPRALSSGRDLLGSICPPAALPEPKAGTFPGSPATAPSDVLWRNTLLLVLPACCDVHVCGGQILLYLLKACAGSSSVWETAVHLRSTGCGVLTRDASLLNVCFPKPSAMKGQNTSLLRRDIC